MRPFYPIHGDTRWEMETNDNGLEFRMRTRNLEPSRDSPTKVKTKPKSHSSNIPPTRDHNGYPKEGFDTVR